MQQVNKNCFSLTLVPDVLNTLAPYSHGTLRFSGDDGAVEANTDLVTFYDSIFGSQFPNFLTPLNFRGAMNIVFNQDGRVLMGNEVFSKWLINKKVRVVRTICEGTCFVSNVEGGGTDDYRPFETFPCDIWQSNGIGKLQKELSLTLRVSSPVMAEKSFNFTDFNSMQKLESDEIYYMDNKTVLALPCIAVDVPVAPPLPPAFSSYVKTAAAKYAFASFLMVTLIFEVEEWVKNFDHTEMSLLQAIQEDKIIIEKDPAIFNPVIQPLAQAIEKNNILILPNL